MEWAIIWIIVAVILGLTELTLGTFVLAMIAVGAGAAALAAGLGAPVAVQAAVFAGASIASIYGVRPFLRKAVKSGSDRLALGPRAYEGTTVTVLEKVNADGGIVELGGDRWTAYPLEPEVAYDEGEQVTVVEVKGASVIVWRT
ncbi:NfeD family protein [Haloglycomyces albus]|uniref:NfeD family protein n=1 Tax=Haloglycomyces albus TaxID=526067 RepID=UPI00046D32B5|nr:NfeD family protein [Haloglycomyces albus]